MGAWVVDTGLRQNTCLHSGLLQKPQAPILLGSTRLVERRSNEMNEYILQLLYIYYILYVLVPYSQVGRRRFLHKE